MSNNQVTVPDVRMPLMITFGVVGGLAIGSWAYSHMFQEGLTDKEKNGIFKAVGIALALWGGSQILDQEKVWWINVESIAQKLGVATK